jgi:peptidoglycan/xylan/chitin deacetylase (PgdA/CDA1 family)
VQFTNDLDYISKHFNGHNLATLLEDTEQKNPRPGKILHLTFDDGFREMHDIVAPILLKKGIPATFFINSAFTDNRALCYQHKASLIVEYLSKNNPSHTIINEVDHLLPQNAYKNNPTTSRILAIEYSERTIVDKIADVLEIDTYAYLRNEQPYLTTVQIRNLIKQGFTIGAHSIDHPRYGDLTLDEQVRQTTESMRFVKETFNLDYGVFAFPHSDNGVSREYFRRIQETGLVDISFGTAGMIEECVPGHFQRFSLEKPALPAKKIFALQYAKRLWRMVRRKNKIVRP